MPFFSFETWAILIVLCAGLMWALLPRREYRFGKTVHSSVEDLWNITHFHRDREAYSSFISSVDWDDDGTDNGYFTVRKIRIRFQQRTDAAKKRVFTVCVPVDENNQPNGDIYEMTASVSAADYGARYDLVYVFQNQNKPSFWAWFSRFLRQISLLQAPIFMNDALKNSGAFARFEAIHGPVPAPRTLLGMPMTFMSVLLALSAFLWFVWMDSLWEAVALMACLLFHELGHVIAMRRFGDTASRFYFIPIFGGVAMGQQNLSADWKLVFIVLAGPAAGLISVLGSLAIFFLTANEWFLGCAALFALINAANLLPIPMLDGGQIFNALLRPFVPATIRRWISVGLLSFAVAAGLYIQSLLLVVLFTFFIVLQFISPDTEPLSERRPLSVLEFWISAIFTFVTGAALVWLFIYADAMFEGGLTSILAAGPFGA